MSVVVDAIEKLIEIPIVDALGFFFCTLAGVVVNWIWKCKREGITIKSYTTDSLKSTFIVFGSAFAAFVTTLIIEPGVGKATYFAIGIAADSMMNKPPMPLVVRTALDRIATLQNGGNPDDPNTPIVDRPDLNSVVGVHESEAIDDAARIAVEAVGKTYVTGELTPKAQSNLNNGC